MLGSIALSWCVPPFAAALQRSALSVLMCTINCGCVLLQSFSLGCMPALSCSRPCAPRAVSRRRTARCSRRRCTCAAPASSWTRPLSGCTGGHRARKCRTAQWLGLHQPVLKIRGAVPSLHALLHSYGAPAQLLARALCLRAGFVAACYAKSKPRCNRAAANKARLVVHTGVRGGVALSPCSLVGSC